MSHDDDAQQTHDEGATRPSEDERLAAENQPRGSGDLDEAAVREGTEKLEQAGGGH